jgi:hypothetical protein
MNDNFSKKQLKILHLLEVKYNFDTTLVFKMYLPLFFEDKNAENILKQIEMFEEESKNPKKIRSKISILLNDKFIEKLHSL